MREAIKEAGKSPEPVKCGVVIVKNEKIISRAFNSQRKDCDSSAHAEIKAIRQAGKKLKNKNLKGCIAYCTCEPCIMCLAALTHAKVERLFFGISLADVLSESNSVDITTDQFIERSSHKIEIHKNLFEEKCSKLIQ